MRAICIIIFLAVVITVRAEPVYIGLHYGSNYIRATISVVKGAYRVTSNEVDLFEINVGQTADITASEGKVNIFFNGKNYTDNRKIHFVEINASEFKALPAGQKPVNKSYSQNLIAYAYNGRLQLVNEVDLEQYVCGVIEAESGKGHEIEYYKVQAVISRTYALNNLVRHQQEGFQLCDATHCQVYHGLPKSEPMAIEAAASTCDIVIVDADINLITAAFHSNCGGQTANAQDVWSKSVSYLVSRPDTFCVKMPHSDWEKKIPRSNWDNYLNDKRSESSNEPMKSISNKYPGERPVYFEDSLLCFPLTHLRENFKLRSTLFEKAFNDNQVVLTGHGFGHGVGLCQEGAMRMAQLDYCYEDIVHFYYKDVHLIPRYMMWFFQE